jgi:hypothetical protein
MMTPAAKIGYAASGAEETASASNRLPHWSLRRELTADAGSYAPAVLPHERGEALRADSDAVSPLEAVTWRGGNGHALASGTSRIGVAVAG